MNLKKKIIQCDFIFFSVDDSQDHSNAFSGLPYDQYYGDGNKRGQRSDYGHMGGIAQGEYFQSGAGPSGEAGAGDSSGGSAFFLQFNVTGSAEKKILITFMFN